MATVTVLRRAGCTVHFDARQTCCGQPMANAGCAPDAAALARRHLDVFRGTTSVAPSGSCVAMVRHHYGELGLRLGSEDRTTCERTFELAEFLVEVLGIEDLGAVFPHRVAVQRSCHGLRELGHGSMSERMEPPRPSPVERLLRRVRGLTLVEHARVDECCGFGGAFAVDHAAVSVAMGSSRCSGFTEAGADYITGGDPSCLLHLDGVRARTKSPLRVIHVAEILACT
jgi:L-lactate dehydrogenase complex protein LldE